MENIGELSEFEVLAAIARIREVYEKHFGKKMSEKEVSIHLTKGEGKPDGNHKLIANWKTNSTTPTQKYVMKCAKETGTSMDYILYGREASVKITQKQKEDVIDSMVNNHMFAAQFGLDVSSADFCEKMLNGILEGLSIVVEKDIEQESVKTKTA